MTGNQIVAANLKRAREYRGLTQEQAAELLEPWLDEEWKKATFSAAERSAIAGKRQRQFTADEILAFAGAFSLPVAYFLLPPPDVERVEVGRKKVGADSVRRSLIPPESQQAEVLEAARVGIAELHKLLSTPSVAMALGGGRRQPRKPKEKP